MAHEPHAAHATADDEYVNPAGGSGHEHTDASVGMIVRFGVWLAVSAIVVHLVMLLAFRVMVGQNTNTGVAEFPLAIEQGPRLPPEPRLQAVPRNDIYRFRAEEDAVLGSYGWVDREAGVVHIPIEEAMRLTIERGLASRPAAGEAPGMMPTDGSAGRVLERRRQ